jgi:hypothetical protein
MGFLRGGQMIANEYHDCVDLWFRRFQYRDLRNPELVQQQAVRKLASQQVGESAVQFAGRLAVIRAGA